MTFSDDATRLFAFTSILFGTRVGIIACFAGLKKALAVATKKTTTNTPGSHRRARNGIVTVSSARAMSAPTMRCWRLNRSTRGAAIRPERIVGGRLAIQPRAITGRDLVKTQ